MRSLLETRKGLSTVITTLIILVVAVLLATVVCSYAVNVTTTRVQEESLQVFKDHIWQNGTTYGEAAFLIINTGGRDTVLEDIAVRSQECNWTSVYYNKTVGAISTDLTYINPNANGTLLGKSVSLDSKTYTLVHASSPLILRSGWSMIVYVTNPDDVSVSDIGVTIGITVFTANAQYYVETNVCASS
jgi:hypothetical protein